LESSQTTTPFLNNGLEVFWSLLTGLFVAQCWIVLVLATNQLAEAQKTINALNQLLANPAQ
jgi:hypothetical protein